MSRTYKLHLSDDAYDRLERERATAEGMPEPLEAVTPVSPLVSLETAYSQGRKAAYGAIDRLPTNPYRGHSRLHEAWDNGRGDELESFA